MSDNITGSDTWGLTIPVPTDDDTRDASSYSQGQIALADRTIYLKNRGFYSTPAFGGTHTNTGTYRIGGGIVLASTSTNITYATSRIYTRVASGNARFDATKWSATAGAGYQQTALSSVDFLRFYFELPAACILKKVKVNYAPVPTHVALPAVMPRLEVSTVFVPTMIGATLASQVDPTVSYVDYNAGGTLECVLPNYAYEPGTTLIYLDIRGENGANAVEDLYIGVPWIEYTRSQLGQEMGTFVP